ncbi:MAG: sulfur carrier protein ThiS [Deltaproteobacteria bacterium]|nr:sulfur carrier protein ThiS [Deltaproteobacteria bacterium]
MNKRIEIIVNGLQEKVPENSTMSHLIHLFEEDDVHLIVEYNGHFLFRQRYSTTKVAEGDRIEFIHPGFGG